MIIEVNGSALTSRSHECCLLLFAFGVVLMLPDAGKDANRDPCASSPTQRHFAIEAVVKIEEELEALVYSKYEIRDKDVVKRFINEPLLPSLLRAYSNVT